MRRVCRTLLVVCLLPIKLYALDLFPPGPRVDGQGGSFVAMAEGFPALLTNPAGYRTEQGNWTILTARSFLQVDPWRLSRGLEEALAGSAAARGFAAGIATGFGYVGRGLGLGMIAAVDTAAVGEEGAFVGSLDTTVALVGGYSYPVRFLGLDLALGASVRPMVRVHTPLDDQAAWDVIGALSGPDTVWSAVASREAYYGVALAFDAGLQAQLGILRLGIAVTDIGTTRFQYRGSDLSTVVESVLRFQGLPEGQASSEALEIPMVASLGAGVTPFVGLTVHGEIHDFGGWSRGEITFTEAARLGAVLAAGSWAEIRLGLNGGRPALGFGVHLGPVEVDAAYTGSRPFAEEARDVTPRLSVEASIRL